MSVDVQPELIDRLIDVYCDWRHRCNDVQVASEHLTAARSAQRERAFAAYEAALDREEAASAVYAKQARLVARAAASAITAA